MDVGEYLDQWMVRQRLRLRPRTWDAYRLTIDTYIAPTLGDVPLHALGPAAIEQLYGELLDHGGRGDRPLSLATICHVHAVLHKALADAIRMDLLPSNPADRVALPRRDLRDDAPATVQAWTAEGVPIKVVSERLGHATIAMTLDVYAHVLPAMDREAADRFGQLLDP